MLPETITGWYKKFLSNSKSKTTNREFYSKQDKRF